MCCRRYWFCMSSGFVMMWVWVVWLKWWSRLGLDLSWRLDLVCVFLSLQRASVWFYVDMMAPIAGKRPPPSKYCLFAGMYAVPPSNPSYSHSWTQSTSDLSPWPLCIRWALHTRCTPSQPVSTRESEGGMGEDRWWVGEWCANGGCVWVVWDGEGWDEECVFVVL